MKRNINYTNTPGAEGTERNLVGIKDAADWNYQALKSQEQELDLREADVELMKIFDKAFVKVKILLDRIGIDISDLGVDSFNVYTTNMITELGSYVVEYDKIVINEKDMANQEVVLHALVHEIYHNISAGVITLVQHPEKDDGDSLFIKKVKSGYSSKYSFIKKIGIEHGSQEKVKLFVAFNEGITDMLTYLTVGGKMATESGIGYPEEVGMVLDISNKVYGGGKSKTFLHNYFSGGMMHLRKIEEFYGKGSLKILALLDTKNHYEKKLKENKEALTQALKFRDEVIEFFSTDDEERREILREYILKEYA